MGDVREEDREARARLRAARGMTFEPISSLDEEVALHEGRSAEERLAAMAALCRRAWLAGGRAWPSCPRAELPGEIFRIDDAGARHPA